MDKASTK